MILGGLCLLNATFALPSISDKRDPILTNDSEQIIIPPEDNAIREGTHDIIHSAESDNKINNLLESNEKIEKYQAGKSTLKSITIGIIGIGISWLIVSFIFWLLNTITKGSV